MGETVEIGREQNDRRLMVTDEYDVNPIL